MTRARDAVVECEYAGAAPAGEAPLTWAQQFMWEVIAASRAPQAEFDLLFCRDLPAPLSVAEAVRLVRRFVLGHPVTRTYIAPSAGAAPVQHVRASGTVPISLHRGDHQPERLRELVPGTTTATPCSPLLILDGDDAVVRIAMRISHLVTDAFGRKLLEDDFAALSVSRANATGTAPTESRSPLELARFERSAEGSAVERKALEHAAGAYAAAPSTMWPRPRRRPEPKRFWFGQLRSADLLAATRELKREHSLGRAGILVGALATTAAASAGLASALLFTISSNRFSSAWRAYPGALSQEAILHVTLGDSVAETMRTAAAVTMRALRQARYAPPALDAVRRAAEWQRGACLDKLGSAIVLNLLGDEAERSDALPARQPTTFSWSGATNEENLGFYVDAYETTTEFVLGVRVDTSLMPPGEAEAWLRAMEWMIVSTGSREVSVAEARSYLAAHGGRDPGEGPRVLRDGCARVVQAATGAAAVYVCSQMAAGESANCVCYVVDPKLVDTAEAAHAAVMAALPAAQPAIAPSEYVLVPAAPADPTDEGAWSRLPVTSRGTGR